MSTAKSSVETSAAEGEKHVTVRPARPQAATNRKKESSNPIEQRSGYQSKAKSSVEISAVYEEKQAAVQAKTAGPKGTNPRHKSSNSTKRRTTVPRDKTMASAETEVYTRETVRGTESVDAALSVKDPVQTPYDFEQEDLSLQTIAPSVADTLDFDEDKENSNNVAVVGRRIRAKSKQSPKISPVESSFPPTKAPFMEQVDDSQKSAGPVVSVSGQRGREKPQELTNPPGVRVAKPGQPGAKHPAWMAPSLTTAKEFQSAATSVAARRPASALNNPNERARRTGRSSRLKDKDGLTSLSRSTRLPSEAQVAEKKNGTAPSKPIAEPKRAQECIFEGEPDDKDIEFGPGWTKKTFRRQTGKSKGATDSYWYTPKLKYKLRSKKDIRRFMDALEQNCGDEAAAVKALKKQSS